MQAAITLTRLCSSRRHDPVADLLRGPSRRSFALRAVQSELGNFHELFCPTVKTLSIESHLWGFVWKRMRRVGSGVRRILTEQTIRLSEDLASVTTDSEKAIHEVRKRCKRVRCA